MSTTKVVYYVNGVASNIWRRLAASKTFWIVASFVLVAAERWNRGEISGAQFYQIAQVGVIGILIRSAMTKAELAANASNPDVENVHAEEAAKRGISSGPIAGIFSLLMLPFLGACSGTALLDGKGKPIVTGEVCIPTKDGMFCYKPNEPTIVEPVATPPTGSVGVATAVPGVLPAQQPVAPIPLPIRSTTLEK